jgi:hypothetical protein
MGSDRGSVFFGAHLVNPLSGGYKYGEIEWNDRPDLSSEGVPDINKTVTVKQ